ncbi:hypothetical protein BVX99_01470 [bacterium F16]|nr:hypothetical protein BVX99_01470 [bacterium F16]
MTTKMLKITVRRKRKRPFFCDSEKVIKRKNPGTSKPPIGIFRTVQYTPMLDQNVSFTDHSSSSTFYYNQDERQSVKNLTNSTGAAVQSYDYTAYGDNIDSLTSGSVSQRYTYTGRERNETSGNYYFRYRMYGAGLGGFLSRDSYKDGYQDGMSKYAGYFAMKLRLDPEGLYTISGSLTAEFNTIYPYTNRSRAYARAKAKWLGGLSSQKKFDIWVKWEKKLGQWWTSLPECPKKICFKKGMGGARGGPMRLLPVNPDPKKWKNPGKPSDAEELLHDGTHWSMRSKPVGKHANQCTYGKRYTNSKGTWADLLTTPPSSGTVDYRHSGLSSVYGHYKHDVEPVILAHNLDFPGNPISLGSGTLQVGANVREYLKVRPLWAE